jgi:hypothetical protein
MAGNVMGNVAIERRSTCQTWCCQFEALAFKNVHYVKARLGGMAVVLTAPAGGVLLVELLRGQVRESAGIYLLYKALYYGIAISCASERERPNPTGAARSHATATTRAATLRPRRRAQPS